MIERPNIEWKDVPGYEGKFKISNYGDLICFEHRNKNNWLIKAKEKRIEDNNTTEAGYYVTPWGELREISVVIHRIVAITFLGTNNKREDQTIINHKDGNKKNCFVGTKENNYSDGNLEWCTYKENVVHAYTYNLMPRVTENKVRACRENAAKREKPIIQLDLDGNLIAEYSGAREATKVTGVPHSAILKAAQENSKYSVAKGFQWLFKENYDPNKNYCYSYMGKAIKVNQYDLEGNYIKTYDSYHKAMRALGITDTSTRGIANCCNGKRKSYKGYIWKNAE